MTLCDTGPLIALIDADDPHHVRCAEALRAMTPPLVTTWPCLTEAMYLLGRAGGSAAQDELWGYLADGLVRLYLPGGDEWERMRSLMRVYNDAPMDLADASLVVAAERLNVRRVFTIDGHFRAYRIDARHPFDVVP